MKLIGKAHPERTIAFLDKPTAGCRHRKMLTTMAEAGMLVDRRLELTVGAQVFVSSRATATTSTAASRTASVIRVDKPARLISTNATAGERPASRRRAFSCSCPCDKTGCFGQPA